MARTRGGPAKIGAAKGIPYLPAALIDKHVSDLQLLVLV
jgi:hypothetical protein